jgi:hypothetical protein
MQHGKDSKATFGCTLSMSFRSHSVSLFLFYRHENNVVQ